MKDLWFISDTYSCLNLSKLMYRVTQIESWEESEFITGINKKKKKKNSRKMDINKLLCALQFQLVHIKRVLSKL